METHIAYISVGSNLGDKLGNCRRALAALAADGAVRVAARSRLYRTEPVDYTAQEWFINQVVRVETALAPAALLDRLQAVQRRLGRSEPAVRFGPRVIDLDILLYDRLVLDTFLMAEMCFTDLTLDLTTKQPLLGLRTLMASYLSTN